MKNIFIEKSYTKCGGEASPRPFYIKIKIERISRSTAWNAINFVFSVYPSGGLPKHIKTKVLINCIKLFKNLKRVLELVSLPHVLNDFEEIYFSRYINWPNFIAWLPLLLEILGNICIIITDVQSWRHKFWN